MVSKVTSPVASGGAASWRAKGLLEETERHSTTELIDEPTSAHLEATDVLANDSRKPQATVITKLEATEQGIWTPNVNLSLLRS